MEKIICHDCKKELKEGDEYMPYQVGDKTFIKCKECHVKDPVLRNFQPCETYDRVCGYIRPVSQFNPGKVEERRNRVNYKIKNETQNTEGCSC